MFRIAALLLAATALGGCYDPKDNCNNDTNAKIGAYVASQYFIKSMLKSPSTAKFPSYSSQDVIVNFEATCKFKVAGYVDSQNSFGATIRTRYIVDVTADPDEGGYGFSSPLIE